MSATTKNSVRKRKPTIGVTGPDRGGGPAWFFTRLAVWRAGGKAVRITPSRSRPAEGLDGLIIGGGADVDPKLYDEELLDLLPSYPEPAASWRERLQRLISYFFYPLLYIVRKLFSAKSGPILDTRRDALEMKLLKEADEQQLPILGICRGSQLINVYFGGTLHQDVRGFYVETAPIRSILPRKRVILKEGSKLAGILRRKECTVNALHNQAVREPGKELEIVARESNEVVQAIEHAAAPFIIGVQWHPEYLPQKHRQQRIFRALVEAAQKKQAVSVVE